MAPEARGEDELLRLAVDLSPAGILAVDTRGTILLVNREVERLFGWTREELIGQSIELLVPRRHHESHVASRATFFAAPLARRMGAGRELFGVRRDGTEFPVEIGLNPAETPSGMVTLASIVDLTARYEAERLQRAHDERARQAQKLEALGTLAGGIAHDFNNILLGIVGHTELAQRSSGLDAQTNEDLDQVLRAADRGRQLVKRILAFSRAKESRRTVLDLRRPISEAVELLRASLPASVEMRVHLDDPAPAVYADETQIHQIIMNLATNASHAMKNSGALTIWLSSFRVDSRYAAQHPGLATGPHARISVSDTGSGMSADVARRVFEPFFTTKAPGEGTGLGLSLVHGIVAECGGVIELHTEVDKGTRFDIVLPSAEAQTEVESGETIPGPRATGARLLLVEDEEVLGRMQLRLLRSFGYQVTLCSSAVEALETFRARGTEFDALVTDNTMPKMSGLELARRVHELRPELPILMVSGLADREDDGLLRGAGVTAALHKPHTSAELDRAVREVLGRTS